MPTPTSTDIASEEPPAGTVKSIIPCTPLAIVKSLEHIGVYNKILPYGDRAYGKTITVINRYHVLSRSERDRTHRCALVDQRWLGDH